MATVMTAMADEGVSVVLSSHMLAELERVTDYLVLTSHGRVRLDGTVEGLLASHQVVSGPGEGATTGTGWEIIESHTTGARMHQLVRLPLPDAPLPVSREARPIGIEELTLAYLREIAAPSSPTLTGASR